jgi:ribonuclease-3
MEVLDMAVENAVRPHVQAGQIMARGAPKTPVRVARTRQAIARKARAQEAAAQSAVARDLSELEHAIGHVFADRALLERALTHVSAADTRVASNQRLEFLGDRVLGLVIADLLYARFPDAPEGDLSRRLASLVRKETCAEVAAEWGAPDFVRLASGEAQSGGAHKDAILGDLCEAVIGAVFLDGGFDAARAVVRAGFAPRVDQVSKVRRDPKSALQEWAQGRGLPPPAYEIVGRRGPDHAPHFVVAVTVEGFEPTRGEGGSRRIGEQTAAEAFLAREKINQGGPL